MSNSPFKKGKFTMSKSKSLRLSEILDETNPFEIDKCKSKNAASVSEALVYLTVIQVDKFDPPCLKSRDCQYLKDRLHI